MEIFGLHIGRKLVFTAVMFVIAFTAVMILFVKYPNILKCKNRVIRAVMLFCVAFVPGVFMAAVCAHAVTKLWNRIIHGRHANITMDSSDSQCGEEKEQSAA